MKNLQSLSSCDNLLMCKENVMGLEDTNKGKQMSEFDSSVDDEYVQTLLDREIKCGGGLQLKDYLHDCWIQRGRFDGIQYVLKRRKVLGFRFVTAYASVTYLDKFLSRRSIGGEKPWTIRLLSIACLSLAAKMEETKSTPLSCLCAEDYNFEGSVIQKMELLVLNELDWTMELITPFSFVEFFANKFFDNSWPRDRVSRIGEVILGTMTDVKIMCHRQSTIAAAATLFVMDRGFSRNALQLKLGPLASSYSIEIGDIMSCYDLIREMEIERSMISQGIKSPDFSPIQFQRDDLGSSSKTSSAKRKRLEFNQNNPSDDEPDKKGKP